VGWLLRDREPKRCVGWADNLDALVDRQVEQISITGDDQVGASGETTGKDVVIVGITRDARHFDGLDDFDDFEIVGEHVPCCFADQAELPGCGGPAEDVGELLKEARAAEEPGGRSCGQRAE
jgi:hypothetical protein